MQIFISHSSKDADAAGKVCELLEKNGTKCFIAPRDIRSGKEYAEEIVNGIDQSAAVILLMSQNANHSPHVLREVERAVSKSIPILVYKLEEVSLSKSMEYFLMTHQWVNAKSEGDYSDILAFVENLEKNGQPERKKLTAAPEKAAGRKKKGRILAAAAVILLAAGLAVFGICQLVKKKESEETMQQVSVELGDTVVFGSYNGEEISWRVLKLSDDGTQAVLVSADILTMKAYDAAESGKYNWDGETDYWSRDTEADTDMELQIRVRGNSDWSLSNLRTWLNSTDEVVAYADQPPASTAMAELKNGYQNEAGFLHDFTDEELASIVETEIVTNGNALSETDTITTIDRVYLLSLDEIAWFEEAGISKLAVPTQAAIDQDSSEWYWVDYTTYGIKEYCWWLREPVEGTSSKCYLVGNGYTQELMRVENAGLEGYGVRPALTVDLKTVVFRNQEE